MNTKILIAGAVAVLVLGGVYGISSSKKAAAPTTADTEVLGPLATATEQTTDTTKIPAPSELPPKTQTTASKPVGVPPVPTTPAPAPFIATIYYDGTNFTPEMITIPEGGTVQFENVGDKPMWVASANHPTHAKYPIKNDSDCLGSSFDQCKSSGTGTSWGYTFSERGEWRYHNHMRDYDTGTILVLTKEKYLQYLEELQ